MDVGVKSEFSLGLVPDEGYTVSATGPVRIALDVDTENGIRIRRSQLRRKHAADPVSIAPRFPISVVATEIGHFSLSITAHFWLCRAALCRPAKRLSRVPIVVTASAPESEADLRSSAESQ